MKKEIQIKNTSSSEKEKELQTNEENQIEEWNELPPIIQQQSPKQQQQYSCSHLSYPFTNEYNEFLKVIEVSPSLKQLHIL